MSQILTDEEITLIIRECARGSAINRDGSTSHRIARAIEQAILNKLSEQEPVAWLQTSVEDGVDTVIARTHKPDKFNAEWWRFDPLYLHPAPSVPKGLYVIDKGFIYQSGIHTPTLLIGFNQDDWDSRDNFYSVLSAAARSE